MDLRKNLPILGLMDVTPARGSGIDRGPSRDPRWFSEAAPHAGPEPSGVSISGTSPNAQIAAKAPDLSDHLPPTPLPERELPVTITRGHR